MSRRAAAGATVAIAVGWAIMLGAALAAVWTNVDNDLSAKWGLTAAIVFLLGVGAGTLAGLGVFSMWDNAERRR